MIKIKDNTPRVKFEKDRQASIFLRFAVEAIELEARGNTPKKTGDLRNSVLKRVNGKKAQIRWNRNYAVFQESKQYKNYTTAGTGPHFAENAVMDIVKKSRDIARKSGLIK